MATTYRQKPVIVEAMQWDSPEAAYKIEEWSDTAPGLLDPAAAYQDDVAGPLDPVTGEDWGRLVVNALGGDLTVTPRDYVVKIAEGSFTVIGREAFEAGYVADA